MPQARPYVTIARNAANPVVWLGCVYAWLCTSATVDGLARGRTYWAGGQIGESPHPGQRPSAKDRPSVRSVHTGQPDLLCPISTVTPAASNRWSVTVRCRSSRAHGSACLRAHLLQERASTTKNSTHFTALEVPDRTQKNQRDADSVEPVDQREERGMAARGHQAGDSQYDQQHSWQDGDQARRLQGYSFRMGLLGVRRGGCRVPGPWTTNVAREGQLRLEHHRATCPSPGPWRSNNRHLRPEAEPFHKGLRARR
jgi:hypothetical protein